MDAKSEFEAAKEQIRLADHILTINYTIADDPKLLVNIIIDIKKAIEHILNIFLIKENKDVNITFEQKIDFFRENISVKINLAPGYLNMIEEIKTIAYEHENSTVEFARKEKYVICDEDYHKLKTIDSKHTRELLTKAKLFIVDISNHV